MTQENQGGSPYPGLRPFQQFEAAYFYGRQAQVAEVIARLRKAQFVAVLGGSGSGKSSLILAGVIPELRTYALAHAGDFWVPVTTTPGTNHAAGQSPILRLARKFCSILQPMEEPEAAQRIESCAALLRRKHGFAEMVGRYASQLADARGLDPQQANFLLLIDQFEELFHPSNRGLADCDVLIERVLDNFREPHAKIFVVITMRTEHLADCARYLELPDAINAASYLVRRLDSEQIHESIEKPALRYLRLLTRRARQLQRAGRPAAAAARATARLPESCALDDKVRERLLRDAERLCGDPDHLPLLQHLLFRLWEASTAHAEQAGAGLPEHIGEEQLRQAVCARDERETPAPLPADANCLGLCLENWAQRLYQAEPEKQGKLKRVFRSLAFKEPNTGTYTQQRMGFDELIDALGLHDEAALHDLLDAWLSPHCYLFWDAESRTIKVAHESFIRGWSEFHRWVDEDDESFQEYVRLLSECHRWEGSGRSSRELIEGARLKRVCDVHLDEALGEPGSARHFERLLELHRDGAKLKMVVPSVRDFLRHSIAEKDRRDAVQRNLAENERLREERDRQQRHEHEKQELRSRARKMLSLAAIVVVGVLGMLLAAESTLGEKERLLHRAYAIATETQLANDGEFRSLDSPQLPLRNALVGVDHYDRGAQIKLSATTRTLSRLTLRGERVDGIERTAMLADTRSAAALRAVLGDGFWPVQRDSRHDTPIMSGEPQKCALVQDTASDVTPAQNATPARFFPRFEDPSSGLVEVGGDVEPLQIYAGKIAGRECRGTLVLSLPPPLLQGTRVALDADMRHLLVGLSSQAAARPLRPDYVQKYDIVWPDSPGKPVKVQPRGVVSDPALARSFWSDSGQWVVRLHSVRRDRESGTDVLAGGQWLRIFRMAPEAAEKLDPAFDKQVSAAVSGGLCARLEAVLGEKAKTGDSDDGRPGGQTDGKRTPRPYRMLEYREGEASLCVSIARVDEPAAAQAGASPAPGASAVRYIVSVYRFAKDMPVENKRVPVMRGADFGLSEPKEIFVATRGDYAGWLASRGEAGSKWLVVPWDLTAWRSFACPVFRPHVADLQPDVEKFGPAFDIIRKPGDERDQTRLDETALCGDGASAGKLATPVASR